MRRREVLATASLVTATIPGCSNLSLNSPQTETATNKNQTQPENVSGYIRPESTPRRIPPELECDSDTFQRRSGWLEEADLHWGDLTGAAGDIVFSLRVNSLSVERGDTVTFTLRNESGEMQETGNIYQSNFDVRTEEGWQDPRGWVDGDPKPVTMELWEWEAGESRTITYELTEQGIIEGGYDPHEDDLITCPQLPPGRYRFGTAAPEEGDVAVAFDVVE